MYNLVVYLYNILYTNQLMDLGDLKRFEKKKVPPHEQAAKVDEILKVVQLTKEYNYTYWLRKVKKWSFADILAICKEADSLPEKYSKGGFLTNRLSKK